MELAGSFSDTHDIRHTCDLAGRRPTNLKKEKGEKKGKKKEREKKERMKEEEDKKKEKRRKK